MRFGWSLKPFCVDHFRGFKFAKKSARNFFLVYKNIHRNLAQALHHPRQSTSFFSTFKVPHSIETRKRRAERKTDLREMSQGLCRAVENATASPKVRVFLRGKRRLRQNRRNSGIDRRLIPLPLKYVIISYSTVDLLFI